MYHKVPEVSKQIMREIIRNNFLKEKIYKKEKNYKIIMTEKDFCRIKDYNYSSIDYAEVDLIINQKEKLLNDISKIYDKIS